MSNKFYQNKLSLIKNTISELDNTSFNPPQTENITQINPLKRKIDETNPEMVFFSKTPEIH